MRELRVTSASCLGGDGHQNTFPRAACVAASREWLAMDDTRVSVLE
jgi:hypothetical protein